MRQATRAALFLVAALLGTAACAPLPPNHPSWTTRSYYMGAGSGAAARNLGCMNGDKQGRMTLFFGAPTVVNGTYGATLWSAPNRTTAQVAETAKAFVRGYVRCRTNPGFRLLVGVGTSNSAINGKSNTWLRGHGRAWAQMVNSLTAWANKYYPDHVRMFGAWDAEPSWSSFGKAEHWMHGYDGYPGRRPLHANFSADGCPQGSASNGPCNNGWSQHLIYHLAWQHDPALPIPQIYNTSGANARQWHMIDLWGARRGDGMFFYGTLSQAAACRSTGSSCRGTNNGPDQARAQLTRELNSHPATRQPVIQSPSDMDWHP